jgi:1-acyl-sn-glycerol-3-phosphate acyltransferase
MLYRLLKAIVWLGIRIYYREIQVLNSKHLSQSGPTIIIANHPNTLMDAWIMGYINRRKVHFVAKSTFFNSPIKRKLLHALGMIPLNRKADSVVSGVNNKDSFEACYKVLEEGGVLVIFPEGTSFLERQLRELKTGTARIALEVEKRNGGQLNLQIVPVGLNYIDADRFRGKVNVQVGKPIQISPILLEQYKVHQGIAAKQLTAQFRTELNRVFVTIDDNRKEKLIDGLRGLFDTKYQQNKVGVANSIQLIDRLKQRLDEFLLTAPWKIDAIEEQLISLNQQLASTGIRADFLDRTYRKNLYSRQFVQSVLFLLLTFPLFLFGWLHNNIPYEFIGRIVPKLSKDIEYHAPLTVLLGLVIYPINYLIMSYVLSWLLPLTFWEFALYFIAMPISGFFAHFYLRTYHHMRSKRKFSRFARERKVLFEEIKRARNELKALIYND